jgi:hypothetical protein
MSKFTSVKRINTRWRNNDFIGEPGSSHTFADALHEEFLVDWAYQIQIGDIVITETPTTGNIQMATLTVGDLVLTGTATGNFGAGSTVVQGTAPISVSTSSNTSTVSIDQSAITAAAATFSETLRAYVKNTTGVTIPKGSVVYISGSTGDNALISLSTASAEAGSSKTLGITQSAITNDGFGYVIENGLLSGIDTSTATAGQSVWLGNTPGSFVFGAPPAEPSHGVYLGVVIRVQQINGEILVKVQNGYEIDELHDVSAASPTNGDILQYNSTSGLWEKESLSTAGIAAAVHTHAYQPAGTYVTAVNGTAPIAASTDTAGAVSVSLNASYSSSTHLHTGTYANAVHTHGTSDVTSGNFVATLAAGTGVTVTGADANAAAKTVAIGQAVATSDNVTFNQVTVSDYIKFSGWNQAGTGKVGTADSVTVTTAGTYYAIGGSTCEVSFTPDFVGQKFFVTMTGYAALNTTTIQYAFVRVTLTDSSNVSQADLGFSRSENFGTTGRGGTVAFSSVWTSDTTSARKIKLYGTAQTTNGLVLTLSYWQLNVMALA